MMNRKVSYALHNAFHKAHCIDGFHTDRQSDHLIIVEPRTEIRRATKAAGDHAGDAPEALIAALRSEHFTVLREEIEIESHQGELSRFALRQAPIALQEILEIGTSEQSCQFIVAHVREHGLS